MEKQSSNSSVLHTHNFPDSYYAAKKKNYFAELYIMIVSRVLTVKHTPYNKNINWAEWLHCLRPFLDRLGNAPSLHSRPPPFYNWTLNRSQFELNLGNSTVTCWPDVNHQNQRCFRVCLSRSHQISKPKLPSSPLPHTTPGLYLNCALTIVNVADAASQYTKTADLIPQSLTSNPLAGPPSYHYDILVDNLYLFSPLFFFFFFFQILMENNFVREKKSLQVEQNKTKKCLMPVPYFVIVVNHLFCGRQWRVVGYT